MIHPCSNTHTNTHATPTDFLIHSNYSACYYCLILLSRSLYLCSFFIPLLINSASFVRIFRFCSSLWTEDAFKNFVDLPDPIIWIAYRIRAEMISSLSTRPIPFHSHLLSIFLFQFSISASITFSPVLYCHTRVYCLFLPLSQSPHSSQFSHIHHAVVQIPFGCAFNNFILHLKQILWTNVANNQIINMIFTVRENWK